MNAPRSTVLLVFFVVVAAVSVLNWTAVADVTGSIGTHIAVSPQTTVSEFSPLEVDVQNELNLSFALSGLSSTLHTHFGIAGVEDVILSLDATLGFFEFSLRLTSARFAYGKILPFYDELHFIMQQVHTSINLGGVIFTNDAQFEDTNAFISQDSAYALGDVFQIEGQTISGISIHAATGICMQQIPTSIKKHYKLSDWSVNPDCATSKPMPDLLFDFEHLAVVGIPIAPGVYWDMTLNCIQTSACALTNLVSFSGTSIPFAASLTFSDLFEMKFGGAEIIFTSGSGTLILEVTSEGTLGAITAAISTTLNPDANPATFAIHTVITPGVGLAEATLDFQVERLGMTFGTKAEWISGPPAIFSGITFSVNVPADVLSEVRILPGPDGILQTQPAAGSDDEIVNNAIVPGRDGVLETEADPNSDDFLDQSSALRMGLETAATFNADGLIRSEIFLTIEF